MDAVAADQRIALDIEGLGAATPCKPRDHAMPALFETDQPATGVQVVRTEAISRRLGE